MSLSPEEQKAQQERKRMALRALMDLDDHLNDKENIQPNENDSLLFDKQLIQQSTPKTRIDELKSQYEKEIMDLKEQLTGIKNLLPVNNATIEEDDFSVVKSSIETLIRNIEEVHTEKEDILKDKEELDKELKDVKKQNENLIKDKEELNTQLRQKLEASENKNSDLVIQLDASNTKICQLNKNNIELTEKYNTLHEENDNFCNIIRENKATIESLEKELAKLQKSNKEKEELLSKAETEQSELKESLQRLIEDKNVLDRNYSELETQNKNMEERYSTEITGLTDNISSLNEERERLKSNLQKLILFDQSIGTLILDAIVKNEVSLSDSFRNQYPNITFFKTIKDEETIKTCLESVEKLLEIKEVLEQISHTIDDQETKKNLDISDIIKKIEQNEDLLTSRNETLMEENKKHLVYVTELRNELNILKASSTETENELLKLKETHDDLKEQLIRMKSSESEVKTRFMEQEKELIKMQALNNNLREDNKIIEGLTKTNKEYLDKIQSIQGDLEDMLTFEKLHSIDNTFTFEEFQQLQLKSIESLTLVELQNIVKKVSMLLRSPVSKFEIKIPLAAIQIIHERKLLLHFANIVNELFTKKKLSMKEYTDSAFSRWQRKHNLLTLHHPLQDALQTLYSLITDKYV